MHTRSIDNFIQSFWGNTGPQSFTKTLQLSLGICAMLLVAGCQTTTGGGQPQTPPSPSGGGQPQPVPTPPTGGGQVPSPAPTPSTPPSIPGGTSTPSTSPTGEGQSPTPSTPSSSEGGQTGSDKPPPEWEDGDSTAGESTEGDQDGDVTFEEPTSDGGFEEPQFEESGGLSEQELEDLEAELEESLGDFDEDIQREQTYAEERANEQAGDDDEIGGIGEFETYSEENDGEEAGQGQAPTVASSEGGSQESGESAASEGGAGGAGGEGGEKRQGSNPATDAAGQERGQDTEPDTPDLRKNDDIVARQIREAAEAESDPVLKEKLWEEYYKYKGQ